MTRFRVYIEETSTRLFSKTVKATTREEAEAFARASLEDETWSEWEHSSSEAALEVREELTGVLAYDGQELTIDAVRKPEPS